MFCYSRRGLLRLATLTEVEDRKQSGAAVGADHNTKARNRDLTDLGIRFPDLVTYVLGIRPAALLAFTKETDISLDISRKMTSFPVSSSCLKKS